MTTAVLAFALTVSCSANLVMLAAWLRERARANRAVQVSRDGLRRLSAVMGSEVRV